MEKDIEDTKEISRELQTNELADEEKERIKRERLREMRIEKALERQQVIASWASQKTNFIAILLLIFFLLLIIVSVMFRPTTPLPSQPLTNEEIKKQEEQKK